MRLLEVGFEVICGVSLGVEFSKGEWVGEEEYNYLIIDLLIFRTLLVFERG